MSVRCISKVLDDSAHCGTDLLMLVVLADYSDDEGNSYPAVASLARKCRTSPRHANRILGTLRDSGELEIRLNEGPKGTNRYRIVLRALGMSRKLPKPPTPTSPLTHASPLTPTSATPDMCVPKPLTHMSDEPSLNRQEPSGRQKLPLCPHADIVSLFHEALPDLPRVKLMGEPRKKAIGGFWKWVFTEKKADGTTRANTSQEALTWIGTYFARARSNDFLMGRTARGDGHGNWRCDFDFLLTEKGKRQVIEKTTEETA